MKKVGKGDDMIGGVDRIRMTIGFGVGHSLFEQTSDEKSNKIKRSSNMTS
jgi:hypothetical protein